MAAPWPLQPDGNYRDLDFAMDGRVDHFQA
jgi:hypothetical protein